MTETETLGSKNLNYIEEAIKEIILENLVNKNIEINHDTDLLKDIGLDSISLMMIIIKIEERFNIELPDGFMIENNFNQFDKITTMIGKLVQN